METHFNCIKQEIVRPDKPVPFPDLNLPTPHPDSNNNLPGQDGPYNEAQRKPIWWYHSDHLGSSTYLTDNFGRPSHYYETLPFGEMIVEHNQSAVNPINNGYDNKYKFNGKELDDATGMYYYGARYYDPRISIFVSADPLAEETMDPYGYVYNNPINLIDPTGMGPEDWVYNKAEGTYHWDSEVSKPSDIKDDNYEYVGPSKDDIGEHYRENNPLKSYVTNPKIGKHLNAPWPGEINTKETTTLDKWESSESLVGKITYSMVNDPYVALQAFNPFQDRERITNIAGYGVNGTEILDSGVSTISSAMPIGRLTKGASPMLKTLNASQFSSKFKGTILTQTSHAKRGQYNRTLNQGIRAINRTYNTSGEAIKSNVEMFAPIIRDDMRERNN